VAFSRHDIVVISDLNWEVLMVGCKLMIFVRILDRLIVAVVLLIVNEIVR
jgi:hypothetical protein